MNAANLDLVVRARRAVADGAIRPCPAGVRAGRIVTVATFAAAPDAAAVTELPRRTES
jgi:allantoinase